MKIIRNLFCTSIVLLMSSCVAAPAYADLSLEAPDKPLEDQWIFAIGGWSKHMSDFSDDITNETHNILAVERDGWSAGYFENSYGRDTFFVGHTWRKEFFMEHLEFSAQLGINYGYRECFGDKSTTKNICPHGYLGVGYTKYRVVPTIKMIPGIDESGMIKPAVILFSPEIRF